MHPGTKRGIIKTCDYTTQYDDDGIEYKQYTLTIDNQKLNTKLPRNLYLQQGMEVILEVDGDEVLSGLCIKEQYEWGKRPGSLKSQLGEFDQYEYVEGTIVEKRKSVSNMPANTDSSSLFRVSFTIVLKDKDFYTSEHDGKKLKAGMQIGAVLTNGKDAVLILDKQTGKILGLARPYYLLFIFLILAFNAVMYYLFATNQTGLINYNITLIVINVFLVLGLGLSLMTFLKTQQAKRFLVSKTKI